MEEILYAVMIAFLYVIYFFLVPVVMIIATPFVLSWPGKKRADGTREKRLIKERYARIWRFIKGIGVGLPTS